METMGDHVKSKKLVILAVIANAAAVVLNFPEFLMGHPVTIENKIVTGFFLVTWAILISWGIRTKNTLFTKFATIYWSVAFVVGLATYFTCLVDIDATPLLLPVILFVTPTYGLIGMAKPYIPNSTIIFTGISAAMLILGANAWIKTSAKDDKKTEEMQ